MGNQFVRNLILGTLKDNKLSKLQKELSSLPFIINFYVKICLAIKIIFIHWICRMLRLRNIIDFNVFQNSFKQETTKRKIEQEKFQI